VKCPIAVLAERDVKGLYKKALAGELKGFTGVSDPYEEPLAPDVVVETDRESVEFSIGKILLVLEQRALIPEADFSRPRRVRSVFPQTWRKHAQRSRPLRVIRPGRSLTILKRLFLERQIRKR
jgi:hypothetical protein